MCNTLLHGFREIFYICGKTVRLKRSARRETTSRRIEALSRLARLYRVSRRKSVPDCAVGSISTKTISRLHIFYYNDTSSLPRSLPSPLSLTLWQHSLPRFNYYAVAPTRVRDGFLLDDGPPTDIITPLYNLTRNWVKH